MATQREILDACVNDESRQKLNEKKKTQVPPQNTIERQPKNKISRQGTKPSVARSSTEKKKKKNAKQNKTKTGQAQLRTYLPTFRKNKNNAVDDYNQTAAKTTWSIAAAAAATEAEAARSALEQGNRFVLRLSALCPETAKTLFSVRFHECVRRETGHGGNDEVSP